MASIGIDDFFATLSQLNTALKDGEFSAVELVRAFSERLTPARPAL